MVAVRLTTGEREGGMMAVTLITGEGEGGILGGSFLTAAACERTTQDHTQSHCLGMFLSYQAHRRGSFGSQAYNRRGRGRHLRGGGLLPSGGSLREKHKIIHNN